MSDDESYVIIKYEIDSILGRTGEPDDYVINIPFRIMALPCDHPKPEEIEIGKGKVSRVQVCRALNDNVGLNIIFDASQPILDAGNALFNAEYSDFKSSVLRQFPDAFFSEDLLLIEQIELDAPYRGQQIGLAIIQRITADLTGGCSLVVGKPFPLNTSKTDIKARDKLCKYWQRLGWQRIGKSDHWGIHPFEAIEIEDDLPMYVRLSHQKMSG